MFDLALRFAEKKRRRILAAARSAAPIFAANGWEYAGKADTRYVPGEADLALVLYRLVLDSYRFAVERAGKHACVSTGRWSVVVSRDPGEEDYDVSMELELGSE